MLAKFRATSRPPEQHPAAAGSPDGVDSSAMGARSFGYATAPVTLVAVLLGACVDYPASRVCQPGRVEICRCADGEPGTKICRADGAGFDPCSCDTGGGGAGGAGGSGGGVSMGGRPLPEDYRTVEQLYDELGSLAADHSEIAERIDYGDSFERWSATEPAGYDLMALRVTAKAMAGPKPVCVLAAGYHGDEVVGTEVARRMAHWLVEGYGVDADATWLVDYRDTWVIPAVNPDSLNIRRNNANAVNLNRNHTFKWEPGEGRGEYPASEPEIFFLEDLLSKILVDQRGPADGDAAPPDTTGIFVTLHAPFSHVLWPWAWSETAAPNAVGLRAIGEKMAATVGYGAGQTFPTLYEIHGCATDWVYGTFGVPAVLNEIGPSDRPLFGHVDTDIWPAHREALTHACRIARAPYQLAHGPDVWDLGYERDGTTLRFVARIDDSDSGGELVTAAELFLDGPPWEPGSTAIALAAADGQYDSDVELVTATVGVDALPGDPLDPQLIFVRGRDGGGHWGPPRALFVDLDPG